jgi:hypothetical protein
MGRAGDQVKTGLGSRIGAGLAALLPDGISMAFAKRLSEQNPQLLLEVLGPRLNRGPSLDTMPLICRLQARFNSRISPDSSPAPRSTTESSR